MKKKETRPNHVPGVQRYKASKELLRDSTRKQLTRQGCLIYDLLTVQQVCTRATTTTTTRERDNTTTIAKLQTN